MTTSEEHRHASQAGFAFAATEAIRSGDWDDFIGPLFVAITKRRELYNQKKSPSRAGLEDHQVWAWMNGPGRPHWEVRGTGLVLDELTEAMTKPISPEQLRHLEEAHSNSLPPPHCPGCRP